MQIFVFSNFGSDWKKGHFCLSNDGVLILGQTQEKQLTSCSEVTFWKYPEVEIYLKISYVFQVLWNKNLVRVPYIYVAKFVDFKILFFWYKPTKL